MDQTVDKAKQESYRDFYTYFGSNIEFIEDPDVTHFVPSLFHSKEQKWRYSWSNCKNPEECNYDTFGAMFSHVLTNLQEGSIFELNPFSEDWRSLGVYRRFL